VPSFTPPRGDPTLFAQRIAACLEPLFAVSINPDGPSLAIASGPHGPGPHSSAEDAEEQALLDRCSTELGY
jgi:hypothetical protein